MTITVIPSWWILLMFISLLIIAIYLDFISRPQKNRWIRILMLIISLTSLAGMYMQPVIEAEAGKKKVAFYDDSTSESIIDSLRQSDFLLIESLKEYEQLADKHTIETLVLTGNGLPFSDLQRLKGSITYLPSAFLTEGPVELLTEEAIVESPLQLRLKFALRDSLRLVLSGAGIESYTKKVTPDPGDVSFEVLPKVAGNMTWRLDGIRQQDTIFSEVIPIKVEENSKINVLMLGNTPSFEYRFLKNHLAASGFGIAEKLQVSSDVFHEAFTNLNERSLASLTIRRLKDFNLVVLNAAAYTDMSVTERNNLKKQLRLGELGLVWTDNISGNDLVKTQVTQIVPVEFRGKSGAVELKSSGERLSRPGEILKFQNQVVGEIRNYGLGKVVLPRISATYSAILKGDQNLYAGIWQKLLQPVTGVKWKQVSFATPTFPRKNEITNLSFYSTSVPERVLLDSVRLAPQQKWYQPEKWDITLWPKKRGWNSISDENIGTDKFFVYDSGDWSAQKSMEQRQQTMIFSRSQTLANNESVTISKSVSNWYFFFAFLFASGFLWLEQRLS